MSIDGYRARAAQCEANAAVAPTEDMRERFVALAAHWRALAVQTAYVQQVFSPARTA